MTIIPCSSSWLITRGWAHPLGTAPPDCAAYDPGLPHVKARAVQFADRPLQHRPQRESDCHGVLRERIAARAAARRGK